MRIVGLEDADGDYVDSQALECVLIYDPGLNAPEVSSGTVRAWLYPDLDRADLAEFVKQVTTTGAFRLLLERQGPIQ